MEEQKTVSKVSASKVRWLLGEISGWVNEGLISEEAAVKLSERYRQAQAASGRVKLIYALGIMAALLLGTGVILFFAANWQNIPRFGKLAIICLALMGAYAAGYELKYRRGFEIVGESVIMVGAIFFGAGIYLVAQAFNINAHFPNGALLWMVGIVPLFFLIKSKPILAQITALFCIWIILEAVAAEEVYDWGLQALKMRSGLAIFLLGGVIYLIYKYGNKANAFLIIPSFFVWLTIFMVAFTPAHVDENEGHVFLVYIAALSVFGALGVLHRQNEKLPPFGGVYQFFAIVLLFIGLYLLTFAEWVEESINDNLMVFPVVMILLCIAVLLVIWSYLGRAPSESADKFSMEEVYIYLALAGVIVILFFAFISEPHNHGRATLISIFMNIVLLGFIISLISIGYRGGYPRLINMGIAAFGVDFVTRYFDWFWDLLPRSAFFIAGGLILLLGGVQLERRRKKWVLKAKEGA